MAKYQVQAIRQGRWWALEFGDVDARIHSQVRRLEQAPAAAAEAIAFSLDIDVAPTDVDVEALIDDELTGTVAWAVQARARATVAASEAAEATVLAVKAGLDRGLATRDIAELLGVSFQRVSQLARE